MTSEPSIGRQRTWILSLFLAAMLGLLSTCTGTDDKPPVATPFGTGADFSIVAALRQVPLEVGFDDSIVALEIVDFRAASLINGLLVLDEPSDPSESSVSYALLPGGHKSLVYAPQPWTMIGADPVAYKEEVGFSVLDIGASIEAGVRPPDQFTIVSGDLQSAAVNEVADGVFTLGEGEDYSIDALGRTAARPLGRPLRVGLNDGLIVMSSSTDSVSAWLDPDVARHDSIPSLVLAAEALDRRSVLSAFLLQRDYSAKQAEDLGFEPESPLLAPFDTIGLGWSAQDGVGFIAVVFVFDDEAAAKSTSVDLENLFSTYVFPDDGGPIAGSPLSEELVVDVVSVEGQVVVVSLRLVGTRGPDLIHRMVAAYDTPFVYHSEAS